MRIIKVVLQGSPRSPDIYDLSEYHRLYNLGRHTEEPSPSYQFNSLNFDSKKISVRSVEDHLKGNVGFIWNIIFSLH